MEYLRRRLSDGNFLAGGGGDSPGAGPGVVGGGGAGRPPPPLLLVIAPPSTDWVKLFKGKSVHGDVELRVEQAQFSELSLVASTHGALSVTIHTPRGGTRRVRPDFVLVREPPDGGSAGAPRRLLVGLHLGGVPSTDPLPALYAFAHPPCLFAQLVRLQRELGPEAFPLVPQRFCNRPRGLLAAPTFPMMVTLSPAPAGVGKVRVGSPEALGAVAGAMGEARAGALVHGVLGGTQRLRVQRIGDEYRALRWSGDPTGEGAQMELVALSPRHRGWVDACARLFGGVDICGVEALRGPDGREHIVQVLGSWMPLVGPGAAEDRGRIVELVLNRMRAELPRPRSPSPARPRPQMTATSGSTRTATPTQQRPPPQGAPPPSGPAQPRPQPQGQPRPPGGVASPRPASPGASPPRGPAQPRPPGQQPRPQTPPTSPQPRPQAPPTSPQPRPQTPPPATQPRPQAPPTAQPRPQAPPTSQPRPQAPPTAQPRPQAPPTGMQPRAQAPPTSPQPRPQAPPTSPQPRPQAPPASQPRPQAPLISPQPRPQAPPTVQPRPQAPPTSPQPRHPGSPSTPQPRPQTPPAAAQPRPPGPQAQPTTRQPRPQAPPLAPKPALAPKPGTAQPPSPTPEQGGPEGLRSLRQSFASLFTD
ncbi:synapsin-1 [Strigops habroptila]|uniref:synapsin-1 n=1 Tax=Strigops habroptila TaxID=2489341 RepID=UPI0011CEF642|nr:synapsin-1 [Strigops habroptila]